MKIINRKTILIEIKNYFRLFFFPIKRSKLKREKFEILKFLSLSVEKS